MNFLYAKNIYTNIQYIRFTDGVVTSLDLGYNGLNGTLPAGILSHLNYLTVLRMNGNELGGQIDVEILKAKARVNIYVHTQRHIHTEVYGCIAFYIQFFPLFL